MYGGRVLGNFVNLVQFYNINNNAWIDYTNIQTSLDINIGMPVPRGYITGELLYDDGIIDTSTTNIKEKIPYLIIAFGITQVKLSDIWLLNCNTLQW